MQLLYEVESVLRVNGFRTARAVALPDSITFEDESILGFVSISASADDVLLRWRDQQDHFLRSNAAQLRRDQAKSWNVYAIYLTAAPGDNKASELVSVEADVNATRKIARSGIITRADVIRALAPILPLAIGPDITGGASANSVVRARLDQDERHLFEQLSARDLADEQIITWLMETTQ